MLFRSQFILTRVVVLFELELIGFWLLRVRLLLCISIADHILLHHILLLQLLFFLREQIGTTGDLLVISTVIRLGRVEDYVCNSVFVLIEGVLALVNLVLHRGQMRMHGGH